MSKNSDSTTIAEDIKTLQSLGYAQELLRRMNGFSNFAISFSIICILAGGITSLQLGISGVGGASIGLGWPLGVAFSILVALAMGQIASAFPTAGGLYHWGAILGGTGWGWITAWFNLAGLVTVLAAINVGAYQFMLGALGPALGLHSSQWSLGFSAWIQFGFVALLTVIQAIFNHLGIRLTTLLTDFSGYLIFAVSVALTITLFYYASSHEFSRLIEFRNFSGPTGGDVWPRTESLSYLFLLGLLLPAYTITGFDASAHTAEETINAARNVPRGMVQSVIYSGLFGWVMLVAIVLALPDVAKASAQGGNVFYWLMDSVVPGGLRFALYLGIGLSQFLCGLATLTSTSRMFYAFARDGGLPWSSALRKVSPKFRTPYLAIWAAALISVAFTVYTPVYSTITVICVIFLYVSYVLPIALGLFAYGRKWKKMGPWSLGVFYPAVATVCVIGCLVIIYIGVQPPNDQALKVSIGALVLATAVWFSYERKRFKGPPRTLGA